MGIPPTIIWQKSSEATEHASTKPASTESEWENLEAFAPVEAEEAKHVSIIAAAIAAQIIQKANLWSNASLNATQKPRLSRLLPPAIAAGESNDSQWAVKEIYQKRKS